MHGFRLVKVREVVAVALIVTVRRHMPNADPLLLSIHFQCAGVSTSKQLQTISYT